MSANGNLEIIAQTWLKAFNERNLEKLLSLYHEEAVHYSPKLKIHQPESKGLVSGKDALRKWWQDAFNRIPEMHYQVNTLTSNDQRVFMEYTRQVPTEPDIQVAEVLEIADGLIVASRVYHG